MGVIRQINDRVAVYSPRPRSQSDHSGDEGSQAQERSKRSPTTSAGGLQDEDYIERLWETEGLSAVKKAFNEKERKRKKEKECATHGHGVVQLQNHLRHDGHFAPARPKHMRKELDQGEQRAKPRYACCGDAATGEPNLGVSDGDLQEEYCGFQYFGDNAAARPRSQAECFNSSFELLTIEPRKLRTGFRSAGCNSVKHVAARAQSPCLSVELMHSSCGSLSPFSLEKLRLTYDNIESFDDDIFCDIPTNISPPASPSGCPVKIPDRKISASQYHDSSGVTYEDADHLSPRQYGLYKMANVGLRANSSQRVTNQFRTLGIDDDFPDSPTRPTARAVTEALNDAHQMTLQKARNSGTATRLDNMKASILCHGFYPRLVEAYIRHRRVGASPELKKRLGDLQAQVRDWKPPNMTDFNANEAVNEFYSMIMAYEKDLETPFQKSMSFCDGLEKELASMESTTRADSPAIRSMPQEHIRSELHDHFLGAELQ